MMNCAFQKAKIYNINSLIISFNILTGANKIKLILESKPPNLSSIQTAGWCLPYYHDHYSMLTRKTSLAKYPIMHFTYKEGAENTTEVSEQMLGSGIAHHGPQLLSFCSRIRGQFFQHGSLFPPDEGGGAASALLVTLQAPHGQRYRRLWMSFFSI